MQTKLNIPEKIHAGFQKRHDTYTGKLAYIIYTDEKGKKRKERSWESWKHDTIPSQDFDNTPIEGFVLNKGVGGARESYGWNSRNEYIRIYDPRGFEFEISVANLLFILQECTSTKGKGIEGKFVYSWSGTELVLLPVTCKEYQTSKEFTSLKSLKVTKKDMVEGYTYQHKNTHELIYLGRKIIRDLNKVSEYYSNYSSEIVNPPSKKYHTFYDTVDKQFVFEKGFTNLAKVIQQEVNSEYSTLVLKLDQSKYCSPFKKLKLVETSGPSNRYIYNSQLMLAFNSGKKLCVFEVNNYKSYNGSYPKNSINEVPAVISLPDLKNPETVKKLASESYKGFYGTRLNEETFKKLKESEKIYTLKYELESGELLGVYGYV